MFKGIIKKNSWYLIFGFCFLYWSWLVFHSKMVIVFDSIHYESVGRLIYQNGWQDFFRTGPHREVLYLALIAVSMAWGKFLSLDYQIILKVFQLLLLFSTQLFLIMLMRKLKIRQVVVKSAVLYFGVSPAVINAALSMYYEIVVFPFVVCAVLLAGSLWADILNGNRIRIIFGKSVLFGACFVFLAFGRDIFQVIFYFFISLFCVFLPGFLSKDRKNAALRALMFILAAFSIFFSSITCLKTVNLRYNGHYLLCGSHLSNFIAGIYKRCQPVTSRIVAAHIASVPGRGVCEMFFSQKECDYADWHGTDLFRTKTVVDILAKIPRELQERQMAFFALKSIAANPVKYLFFSVTEALKMFFWESTKIGFVEYPAALKNLYDNLLVRLGLRLVFGLLTVLAFVFSVFNLKKIKFKFFKTQNYQAIMLFFVLFMISVYTILYSTCYVVTRYALPIASLYLACVAFAISAIIDFNLKDRG